MQNSSDYSSPKHSYAKPVLQVLEDGAAQAEAGAGAGNDGIAFDDS